MTIEIIIQKQKYEIAQVVQYSSGLANTATVEAYSRRVNELVESPISPYILLIIWDELFTSKQQGNFLFDIEILNHFSEYLICISSLLKRCIDPMSSFLKFNPRENDQFLKFLDFSVSIKKLDFKRLLLQKFDDVIRDLLIQDKQDYLSQSSQKVIAENFIILQTNIQSYLNTDINFFSNQIITLNSALIQINTDNSSKQQNSQSTFINYNINLILDGILVVRSRSFYAKPKEIVDEYLKTLFNLYFSMKQHPLLKFEDQGQKIDNSILATISWGQKHPILKKTLHQSQILSQIENTLELIKTQAFVTDYNAINKHSFTQFKIQLIHIADILVENCVDKYTSFGKNQASKDINDLTDGIDHIQDKNQIEINENGIDLKYILYLAASLLNLIRNYTNWIKMIKPNQIFQKEVKQIQKSLKLALFVYLQILKVFKQDVIEYLVDSKHVKNFLNFTETHSLSQFDTNFKQLLLNTNISISEITFELLPITQTISKQVISQKLSSLIMQIEEDMCKYQLEVSNFIDLDRCYNREENHFLIQHSKKQDIFSTTKKIFIKVLTYKGSKEIVSFLDLIALGKLQFQVENGDISNLVNMELMKDLLSYISELNNFDPSSYVKDDYQNISAILNKQKEEIKDNKNQSVEHSRLIYTNFIMNLQHTGNIQSIDFISSYLELMYSFIFYNTTDTELNQKFLKNVIQIVEEVNTQQSDLRIKIYLCQVVKQLIKIVYQNEDDGSYDSDEEIDTNDVSKLDSLMESVKIGSSKQDEARKEKIRVYLVLRAFVESTISTLLNEDQIEEIINTNINILQNIIKLHSDIVVQLLEIDKNSEYVDIIPNTLNFVNFLYLKGIEQFNGIILEICKGILKQCQFNKDFLEFTQFLLQNLCSNIKLLIKYSSSNQLIQQILNLLNFTQNCQNDTNAIKQNIPTSYYNQKAKTLQTIFKNQLKSMETLDENPQNHTQTITKTFNEFICYFVNDQEVLSQIIIDQLNFIIEFLQSKGIDNSHPTQVSYEKFFCENRVRSMFSAVNEILSYKNVLLNPSTNQMVYNFFIKLVHMDMNTQQEHSGDSFLRNEKLIFKFFYLHHHQQGLTKISEIFTTVTKNDPKFELMKQILSIHTFKDICNQRYQFSSCKILLSQIITNNQFQEWFPVLWLQIECNLTRYVTQKSRKPRTWTPTVVWSIVRKSMKEQDLLGEISIQELIDEFVQVLTQYLGVNYLQIREAFDQGLQLYCNNGSVNVLLLKWQNQKHEFQDTLNKFIKIYDESFSTEKPKIDRLMGQRNSY